VAEARGRVDGYRTWLTEQGFECVEVSDGTIDMARERKLELIDLFARDFKVLSEVGSKDAEEIFAPYQWVEWIKEEQGAGAWKVITEARESGTAGIFRTSGEVRSGLIDEIAHEIDVAGLLFEAPQKSQQARHQREPRQHPARRGHLARDPPPRDPRRHAARVPLSVAPPSPATTARPPLR